MSASLTVLYLYEGLFNPNSEVDAQGWTALHHAITATVCWVQAHNVAKGLLAQMTPEWICKKTGAGRPANYAALTLCANGCAQGSGRVELCRLLIDAKAEARACAAYCIV